MQPTFRPAHAGEALEVVRGALAQHQSLELLAGGHHRDYGRPIEASAMLDVSALRGITAYEPGELVLSARPATPLSEIRAALAAHHQHLAFEPPGLGTLYGCGTDGTLGGCLAVGLAGPRRPSAGAPRDHLLGVKGVNGFGEPFSAGGRVVKNVTGFDLPKLLAGSLGTLALMTEVTIRVTPAPAMSRTLLLRGLDDHTAVGAMTDALGSPAQVTAAAHLPAPVASGSQVEPVRQAGAAVTLFRLEGFEPSVQARTQRLRDLFRPLGVETTCIDESSAALWAQIGAVAFYAGQPEREVWRISMPPSSASALMRALQTLPVRYFLDWGGSVLWLEAALDGTADNIRPLVDQATHGAGHAMLVRGAQAVRLAIGPLPPLSAPLAALSARVKRQFDPQRIFNPGRMYPDL